MVYRFGDAELDTDLYVLRGGGRVVRLAPKAFGVLEHLIRNPGRIVSKAELLSAVWADVAVTEGVLTQSVRQARRAVAEVAGEAPAIETVYGRGYRFLAEVREAVEEPRALQRELRGYAERTVPGFSGRPAIAVLPFENLSDAPDQDYFVAGVTDDLVHRLSSWRWFPVVAPRAGAVPTRGTPGEIGRELGVRYAVEGRVRRSGSHVRVTTQVVDTNTAVLLCAERYDGEISEIFALQDAISEALVARITPELQRSEQQRALRKEPASLDAWDSFLRGTWHLQQYTAAENERARVYLRRAHEIDPGFAAPLALAGLSHLHEINAAWTRSPRDSLASALDLARRAIVVDDRDPYAHGTLGGVLATLGKKEEAIAELSRAIELNPSFALPRWGLARGYTVWGLAREAIELLHAALRLSPRDAFLPHFLEALGFAHFALGAYDEAVAWAERSLRERPDWARAHQLRAAACAWLGRSGEARASLERMFELAPAFSLEGLRESYRVAGSASDLPDRYVEGLEQAGWHECVPTPS